MARAPRRLAAIVAMDVAGYSRLMGQDEQSTLARLKDHRSVIDPIGREHGGRIVGTAGDGVLVEFPSIVEAVSFALRTQAVMAERNAEIADDAKMLFRIGINLGDVLIDGDTIYGDGVNVAARLEALAHTGGICLSSAAHDQVRDKLDAAFEDLGEVAIKNIARPVRVYRVSAEPEAIAELVPAESAANTEKSEIDDAPASRGKSSIAVLPFDNMSGDPEQEYFSDGITEDIISTLCHFNDLHVIARNSSFTYKGQAVDLRRVGRELGVRNVLEGSVRRAGNRVRIAAQLIEAETGSHIWAERYDRPIDDIFEVQDEIAALVAGAVNAELLDAKMERAARRGADTLPVWDLCAKAVWHLFRYNADDTRICQELCRQAISLDAGYAESHAILSIASTMSGMYGWSELPPAECYRDAERHARDAIERDRNFVQAHCFLSSALNVIGRNDDAVRAGEHAVQMCPGLSQAHSALGTALAYSGAENSARAIEHLKTSIRLSPRDVLLVWTYTQLAAAEFMREGYDEAIRWARTGLQHSANLPTTHRFLTASLALKGDLEAARSAFAELDRVQPGITIAATRDRIGHVFNHAADLDRYLDGLRKAGMPQG